MNISKTTSSRKKIIISTIILLLLGMTVAAALEKTGVIDLVKTTPSPTAGPTEEEKKQQKKAEQDAKQDFIETPAPTPTETPSPSPTSAVELSARQESNGSVTILTKLHNVSDGTCTLTITNATKTHSQTADVIYQPVFSSCAGFSVARDKLGSGTWSIHLAVAGSQSLEKSITAEVK